uniref:Uncharacterized protein n=1 Tax=Sphaerodactylus townsendi TaxID=933632 RepID=A0ACB8EEA5_9SAUR
MALNLEEVFLPFILFLRDRKEILCLCTGEGVCVFCKQVTSKKFMLKFPKRMSCRKNILNSVLYCCLAVHTNTGTFLQNSAYSSMIFVETIAKGGGNVTK